MTELLNMDVLLVLYSVTAIVLVRYIIYAIRSVLQESRTGHWLLVYVLLITALAVTVLLFMLELDRLNLHLV